MAAGCPPTFVCKREVDSEARDQIPYTLCLALNCVLWGQEEIHPQDPSLQSLINRGIRLVTCKAKLTQIKGRKKQGLLRTILICLGVL